MNKIKKYFLYLTLFVSGAVILIIEIAGARLLAPFYGSTIFVWSSLITITLGFLALGYFIGGFFADKYPYTKCFYFIIFLGGAIALLLIKLNQPLLVFSDRFGFKFGPLVAALFLFSLPLFFLSMAGPFAIRLRSQELERTGHTSGIVFGVSTIGSLVGALFAGFYLVPNFLLGHIFISSTVTIMFVAIIGLFFARASWRIIIGSLALLFLFLFLPFYEYDDSKDVVSIIHHEQSFYADLKVAELPFIKTLLMDGTPQSIFSKTEGKIFAEETEQIKYVLAEHWPSDAEVLVLGFGAGSAAKILSSELRIDYVEIDPRMVALAQEFFGFSLDSNDEMIIADARSFLRNTDKTYDLIFVDLYKASMIPIHTHTKEALALIKAHLKPGGILISNIVGSQNDILTLSLVRTLKTIFPKVVVSAKKEDFANILAYGITDENFQPFLRYKHKEIEVDYEKGVVITDNKNPIEILCSERFNDFHKSIKNIFGYKPLFAI
jgi:spermidine synthase